MVNGEISHYYMTGISKCGLCKVSGTIITCRGQTQMSCQFLKIKFRLNDLTGEGTFIVVIHLDLKQQWLANG